MNYEPPKSEPPLSLQNSSGYIEKEKEGIERTTCNIQLKGSVKARGVAALNAL